MDFSQEVKAYLKREKGWNDEQLQMFAENYVSCDKMQDRPSIEKATLDDAIAYVRINGADANESWDEFKERVLKSEAVDKAANDVYQPLWHGKTEDRPTPWLKDFNGNGTGGGLIPELQPGTMEALTEAFRKASPNNGNSIFENLCTPPADPEVIKDFIDGVSLFLQEFVWQLGTGDNPTWRWGPAITMFGGLGLDALRKIATRMEHEEGWTHISGLNDKELVEEIVNARNISGYPAALLRADFNDVYNAVKSEPEAPKWFKSVVMAHIFKHARRDRHDTRQHLVFMYKGRENVVEIPSGGFNQALNSKINKALAEDLCKTLKLPHKKGKEATGFDLVVEDLLSKITPRSLVAQRDPRERAELIIPNHVVFMEDPTITKGYSFINCGRAALNCARIDVNTGCVEKKVLITGPDVIQYMWPRESKSADGIDSWRHSLPSKVEAKRPSDLLLGTVKNINTLGEDKALRALLDALMIIGLIRDKLAGSDLGSMLPQEFPLVFVYPTGHTNETTTNQGKTSLIRIISKAFVPDFPGPMKCNCSDSPPVQRTMASIIGKYGLGVYDEYIAPHSQAHVLHASNLQAMATGSPMTAGVAGENSEGFYLRYCLMFTSKVANFPEDVKNRQIPFFMDALTESTKLSPDVLMQISGGQLSMQLRLATLMYIQKHGLIEKLRNTKAVQGWRFPAHLAAATMLNGGDSASILRYLKTADNQLKAQLNEAEASGLTDTHGIGSGFQLNYYFSQAAENTLEALYTNCMVLSKKSGMDLLEAMRTIIEDGGRRNFNETLRSVRLRERWALAQCSKELASSPLKRDNWELVLTSADTKRPKCDLKKTS